MCVDSSKLRLQGGEEALFYQQPYISLNIPDKHCRNDPYDSECVTTPAYEEEMSYKMFVTYTNVMRFDQLNYFGESPVIKESKF